ncbi:MAG: hypothetical protein KBT04_01260, partial [Bacteroidales bacterium]|nr:hypothetical protein [Candidatus Colimorpha onthohippi]
TLEVSPDHIDQALCRLSAMEPLTLSASYATITVTDLPAGVTYNSETHVISGKPATHGNSIYTIKATSTEGCENVERKGVIMVFPHDTVRIDTAVCAGTQFVYADFNKLTSPSASDVILPDTNRASTVFHSGCDSVVRVLRLTVHRVDTTRHDAEQICAGGTYSQYGFSHATVRSTQASVWRDTLHLKNQWQCDSTSTLTLAVRPVDSTVFNNEQVCAGTTYNSHGFNIATVRQVAAQPVIHDTVRTVNAAGCDSMAFLSLTVNPVDTFDIPEIDLCAGNTLVSPAYGFEVSLPLTTASSTYTDSHSDVNVHGCDSITNLTLQVHGVDSTKHDTVSVCGGATFVGDGFIITPERSLTDYYRHDTLRSEQNRYGCDSIVTIVVRVKHVDTTIITPEDARICANKVYDLNGFHIPTKPSLTNYIVRDTAWGFNSNGCDSVITLELSVMHNDSTIQQIEDIDTLHWIDGNVYFDTIAADDGVFAILPDTNMCDSVIQLIFNPTVTVSFSRVEGDLDQVLCLGQPISEVVVEAADATITATCLPDGVYYDTETKRLKGTPTAQGMWNYVLTAQSTTSSANSSIGGSFIIFEPLHTAFTETASGSYTWENNDWSQTYTSSGTYTHDYEDINGCSATDTLHLTITPLITVVYDTVCGAMLAERYVDTLLYEDFDEVEILKKPSDWYYADGEGATGFVAANNLATVYTTPSGSGMAMWEISQGLNAASFLVTPKITIDDPVNTHIKFYFRMPANGEKTDIFQVGYITGLDFSNMTMLMNIEGFSVPEWIKRDGTIGAMEAGDYYFYIGHGDEGGLFCAVDSFMIYVNRIVNHMAGDQDIVRYDTLMGHLGNDSIVEHRIHRKPSGSSSYDYVSCGSYLWSADGDRGHGDNLEHDATGIYTNTYTAANGCEATDTLHFTLTTPTPFRYAITVDYSYTWIYQGVTVGTYYKSGKYTYAYTNAAGCTQVDTLVLTVLHSSMGENITIDNACDSFIWYNRDHEVGTYYANAVVYDTTEEGNGALVDTLNLTIVHPVYTTMDTFVCPGNFYKHDYDTILFEDFESSDTLPDGWHQQYEGDNYWRIRDRVDVPITESLSWPYFAANGNHSAF